jgi:hypothetical protein
VILGSVGRGSGMSIWPKLLNDMLGTKFKVVEGYKGGSEVDLSAQRGETQGRWTSYSALTAGHMDWLENKQIKVLLQFGARIPRHKGVPLIDDLLSGDNLKIARFLELSESVGLGFWVPPGVPADRVKILSDGIMAVAHDPSVGAEAAKRGVPFDPLTGAQIGEMVRDAYSLTPAQITRIHAMFATSKK